MATIITWVWDWCRNCSLYNSKNMLFDTTPTGWKLQQRTTYLFDDIWLCFRSLEMWAPEGILSSCLPCNLFFNSYRCPKKDKIGTEVTKSAKPIFPLDLPSSSDLLNNLSSCKDSSINVCRIVASDYFLNCLHPRHVNYAEASNLPANLVA